MIEHGYVPIQWHTNKVSRDAAEMISFVAGILRIHGTTGGWTVWALSGDRQIQHVLKARGGLINPSYPNMGMDVI